MTLIQAIQTRLGSCKIARSGEEFLFRCPRDVCGDKSTHLGVNPRKRVFNCFRCGYGGHVRRLLEDLAIEWEEYEEKVPVRTESCVPIRKNEIPGFLRLSSMSHSSVIREDAYTYLFSRGISIERVDELGIGMVPDEALFSGRVVIPLVQSGKMASWIARLVYQDWSGLKELSPSSGSGYAVKSEVVYDTACNCATARRMVIVEGIFDAEAVHRAGMRSVALLGSHASAIQIGLILTKRPERIDILLDGDSAGRLASKRVANELMRRTNLDVRVHVLPDGKDPDELETNELKRILKLV